MYEARLEPLNSIHAGLGDPGCESSWLTAAGARLYVRVVSSPSPDADPFQSSLAVLNAPTNTDEPGDRRL